MVNTDAASLGYAHESVDWPVAYTYAYAYVAASAASGYCRVRLQRERL